ncbi:MAG TPA: bifunctional phosphoribosylaminoimidazolecarboxamide formyltransferase/IMP cyclohydrolase, partial [Candidatus Omnitrophota bacterium]|nr:bifunctional phosphoribosylaminoimidazolecarboxamide formyltransferase/IMP cyclohydrolase [Candidatus Omnitrophota bacterium]
MLKIKRALISVSDKTGIVEFAKILRSFNVEIISTGGTARALKSAGIDVIEMSDYTGFPEMLDGRVKTLHPKIHGGLLSLRDNPEHVKQVSDHKIGFIDMVVVNLYPFEETVKKDGVGLHEAIENIDIGGPSMLRSAAKNYRFVAVVPDPKFYPCVISELKLNDCSLGEELLEGLALEVFKKTASYDASIAGYLSKKLKNLEIDAFPSKGLNLKLNLLSGLRYGENPHQKAGLYSWDCCDQKSLVNAKQLHGKELSFNNYLDLNSAFEIVREFKKPAACIIKHTNPTGVAIGETLEKAYKLAHASDPLSAFGGIIGLNRKVDLKTAKAIISSGFMECILAPGYEASALGLLKNKKNLRLLE